MVSLYLDEDINIVLASLLRARNIVVSTTLESNMLGRSDREQLDFATLHGSAIVTHNRVDFENLFSQYTVHEKKFSGIVVLIRRNVPQMAQRLSRFALSYETIDNQLWYV